MRFFQSPYLAKGRDVLVVVCDRCHIFAGTLVDGIPLCPDCFAAQAVDRDRSRERKRVLGYEEDNRFARVLAERLKERPMTAPLPPFDLVSVCPKCGMRGGGPAPDPQLVPGVGGLHIRMSEAPEAFPVEYHAPYPVHDCEVHVGGKEHLHRTCPRCDFAWAEACPSADDFLPIGPRRPVPDFQADAGPVPAFPVRPEVAAFALLMERELAKHDDRDGWKHVKIEWLFSRLLEEVEEVRQVLIDLDRDAGGIEGRAAERIGPEAADVANFCMFIADVCGALAEEQVKA